MLTKQAKSFWQLGTILPLLPTLPHQNFKIFQLRKSCPEISGLRDSLASLSLSGKIHPVANTLVPRTKRVPGHRGPVSGGCAVEAFSSFPFQPLYFWKAHTPFPWWLHSISVHHCKCIVVSSCVCSLFALVNMYEFPEKLLEYVWTVSSLSLLGIKPRPSLKQFSILCWWTSFPGNLFLYS